MRRYAEKLRAVRSGRANTRYRSLPTVFNPELLWSIGDETEAGIALDALQARVRALQATCDEATARAALLVALQHEIVKIACAQTSAQIVSQLLRSACDTLGYARVIYFSVDREHGIEARTQIDAGESVEPSAIVPALDIDSPFFDVLRGERIPVACEGGASLPLRDVRGTYLLSPLRHGTRTVGILYVDDRCDANSIAADPSLVHALTAVAAAALGNSVLLESATKLATVDPLTGLLNRRALSERLIVELELCRRHDRSLTYAMIDVDDLKMINDSRGHAAGDRALQNVADALSRSSRAGDVVSRSGGDEFVVIFPGVDRTLARSLVARLSSDLARAGLRCSIGAALFPQDASDEPTLTLVADRALYAVKAAGKDGFAFA